MRGESQGDIDGVDEFAKRAAGTEVFEGEEEETARRRESREKRLQRGTGKGVRGEPRPTGDSLCQPRRLLSEVERALR